MNLDIFWRIKHGKCLVLRNLKWKMAIEDIPVPRRGRRSLLVLCYDNWEMLIADRDDYDEDIDVNRRIKEDGI